MHKGSLFSTSLPTLAISGWFHYSHSIKYEVIIHCGLICISLLISDTEHLVMYWLAICVSSLGKCLVRSSAHSKNQIIVFLSFFAVELYELFVHFGYEPFIRHMICKYFLPFSRWLFNYLDDFLRCAKAFSLMDSHLFICPFVAFAFPVRSIKKKKNCQNQCQAAYHLRLFFLPPPPLPGVLWSLVLYSSSKSILS